MCFRLEAADLHLPDVLVRMADPANPTLGELSEIPPKIGSNVALKADVDHRRDAASETTENGVPNKVVVVTGAAEHHDGTLVERVQCAVGFNYGKKVGCLSGLSVKSRHVKSSLGQHGGHFGYAAADIIYMLPRVVGLHPPEEDTSRAEEDTVVIGRIFLAGKIPNRAVT